MKIKYIVAILLTMVVSSQSFSQTEKFRDPQRVESFLTELYPEAFNLTLMRDAILYYIDRELRKEDYRMLQPNQSLQNASQEFVTAILNKDKSLYTSQLLRLLPSQLICEDKDEYTRIFSVIDFISGMTDVYALEMYRKIKGISFSVLR